MALTEISNAPTLKTLELINFMIILISKVIHELESIPTNLQFCGLEWKTDQIKRYKQIKSQLRLKNEMLVRNYKTDPFSEQNEVIVVPESMKKEMLMQTHEYGGHQGVDRTINLFKLRGYWVGINRDVELHVSYCEVCQIAKLPLPTKAA